MDLSAHILADAQPGPGPVPSTVTHMAEIQLRRPNPYPPSSLSHAPSYPTTLINSSRARDREPTRPLVSSPLPRRFSLPLWLSFALLFNTDSLRTPVQDPALPDIYILSLSPSCCTSQHSQVHDVHRLVVPLTLPVRWVSSVDVTPRAVDYRRSDVGIRLVVGHGAASAGDESRMSRIRMSLVAHLRMSASCCMYAFSSFPPPLST